MSVPVAPPAASTLPPRRAALRWHLQAQLGPVWRSRCCPASNVPAPHADTSATKQRFSPPPSKPSHLPLRYLEVLASVFLPSVPPHTPERATAPDPVGADTPFGPLPCSMSESQRTLPVA